VCGACRIEKPLSRSWHFILALVAWGILAGLGTSAAVTRIVPATTRHVRMSSAFCDLLLPLNGQAGKSYMPNFVGARAGLFAACRENTTPGGVRCPRG